MRAIRIKPTQTLVDVLPTLSPQSQDVALDMIEHYVKELRRLKDKHAPSIAFTLHGLVDAEVALVRAGSPHGDEVKCTRGCAHCCHIPVMVTEEEAALLILATDGVMTTETKDRLAMQANISDEDFNALPKRWRACPFLLDNECSVYEHRPMACRKYNVITDPDLCDTDKHPGGKVGRLYSLPAEIIASAAGTVTSKSGTLSTMVMGEFLK